MSIMCVRIIVHNCHSREQWLFPS